MGWWNQSTEGASFAGELTWGDGPADILGDALAKIDDEFMREWGRTPTADELKAGLLFSLGGRESEAS